MNKRILVSMLCFFILLAGTAEAWAQRSELKDTNGSRYKIGQAWRYWTRPQEKDSSFIVVKVEKHPTLGNIIHIALRGLKIRKPNGGLIETVSHLPLTETAIESSGARLLLEKVELPDYREGYRLWREAFDAGRAGVYSISIGQSIEDMEENLNRTWVPAGTKGETKIVSRRRPFIYQMYNPATNKTEVTVILGNDSDSPGVVMVFPERSGFRTPFQSGILLGSAHYVYDSVRPTGTDSARFTFVTKRKEAYQDPPAFTISVEGQAIHEGETELYLSIYEVNGSRMAEQWVTLKVPVAVFMRVAEAKNVEFKIGEKSYKPENFQQKYMQALARTIATQGK